MKRKISTYLLRACVVLLVFGLALVLSVSANAESTKPALAVYTPDKGLLWKITSRSGKESFLFGTIHSEDARVLDYPQVLLDSIRAAPIFAMELVPNMPTLSKLMVAMRYSDGTLLADKIGAELYQQLEVRLAAYGLPKTEVKHLKIWAAAMTLSVPPPETGMFLDFSLSLRAASMGATLTALETLEEQVGFLEGMVAEDQLTMLHQVILEFDQIQQQNNEMVEVWLSRDLSKLAEIARQQMAEMEPRMAEWFQTEGIDKRNWRMLERALPLLEQGGVFIAVGALHLPGDTGLIKLLRDADYQLQVIW